MKVLFVCRSNGARSQIAEVFFKKLSNHAVKSAGIDVAKASWLSNYLPASQNVEMMRKAFGIDISKKMRKQVTQAMLEKADRVVILMSHSERKKLLPKYFDKYSDKTVFWNMKDMRNVKSNLPLIKRAKRIEGLVQKLIKENDST
jgi:protein-tyrosine-phosphatase